MNTFRDKTFNIPRGAFGHVRTKFKIIKQDGNQNMHHVNCHQLFQDDDKDELLLSCRYGDLDDIKQFVEKFGSDSLNDIRDENGNYVLHMVCGNGHTECLDYLIDKVSPTLLSIQNNAKSTPLHWAALNSHLPIVQKLVQFPKGPGVDLIDVKNTAGRTPLGEAENVGWEEGANWMVGVMNLAEGNSKEEEDQVVDNPADIEVEIQDAEGQVAKMKIGQPNKSTKTDT